MRPLRVRHYLTNNCKSLTRATALVALLIVTTTLVAGSALAIDPANPYPGAAPGATHVLNQSALIGSVNDLGWFTANIPFLEVPDTQIQQVYYYRWQTYKEHLVYTGPIYGWMSSEFLQPVSYGAPYGGVVAAAGHQITEGRWLRNQQYVKDDINYWLNGPGQFPKPMVDAVNANTSDWAHEYSFWAGSAVWQQYLSTGDSAFATALEAALVRQYRGWDPQFNGTLGLYWQVPVWDATELSPASYESSDPYHGGPGYRPTINGYQYGDARAIAGIASLAGDSPTSTEYTNRASALQSAMQAHLWDPSRTFFFHMNRDNNPGNVLLDTRELEGFVPWMFDMPQASDSTAFAELLDPQGFAATYGPTTAERRSSWFMYQAASCCHWDGPSWPYESSQALTAVANVLEDYPAQSTIKESDYLNLLHGYAATQFKNGAPYVAEAHDPDNNVWIYDTADHSEDYNHSTYIDNVISGLIGLRGQPDNTLVVNPLAPSSWAYFALENTPYHGHNVSVFWDSAGTRYGTGVGLSVYVDGTKVASRSTLGSLTVTVGAAITQSNLGGVVNAAANTQRFTYGPQPFASYTSSVDNVWNAVDGIVYRTGIPENSRWTSYATTNASDSYGVNFQRNTTVNEARLFFYDDGGGVRTPASYDLQYWTGSAWVTVPGQSRSPSGPTANALNRITFPVITTSQLRVVAPNAGGGTGWGLSEFQAFSKPVFQIANVNSGKLIAVNLGSLAAGAQVQQFSDNGSLDHQWEMIDAGGGWFKIRNVNSNLVLGVDQMSLADSALIKQAVDNGTADHLWQLIDNGGGQFKIKNKNSGLVLGVDQASLNDSANVVQFHDNGTLDHLWTMRLTGVIGGSCSAAPSAPAGLAASGTTAGSTNLIWSAVTPPANCSITSYTVFKNGTSIGTSTTTSFAVTGLSAATTYSFTVAAGDSFGNSGQSGAISVTTSSGTTGGGGGGIQIACGNSAVAPFVADTDFSGGSASSGTTTTINTTAVVNPAPMSVWQHGRKGTCTYTIPGLTAGASYTVKLDFCEYAGTAAGQRTFNVSINGAQVLTNFDIFAAAGAEFKATQQTFPATANSSGQVVIVFTTVVNNALVAGIEVSPAIVAGVHTLTPQNATGSRLDDLNSGTANGNGIDISAATGAANQQWSFGTTGVAPAGNWNLAVNLGAYCLATAGTTNGSLAEIWACNGATNESWMATKVGTNYLFSPSNAPSLCLNVSSSGTANGTAVLVWTCSSTATNNLWAVN